MKQFLSAILIISLSSALGDPPSELGSRHIQGTDPIDIWPSIFSQPYSFENLLNGYSNYGAGDRWVCDDFVIPNGYVYEIRIWMIWTGSQGEVMNFVISIDDAGDSDPNTSTPIWVESVSCTNTFTGDSNWGYDIYETYIDLLENSYPPELIPGIHYYFETQADVTDNCFALVSHNYNGDYCWYNDGSGIWVRSDVMFGEDSDMFFGFYGQVLSLESETWGSIKTLF